LDATISQVFEEHGRHLTELSRQLGRWCGLSFARRQVLEDGSSLTEVQDTVKYLQKMICLRIFGIWWFQEVYAKN